jgi:predicted enzyme related to lactoylglutathione lyase
MTIGRREVLLLLASASGAAVAADGDTAPDAGKNPTPQAVDSGPAEKVLGFGGFFFRAKDPKALSRWYRDNLGINSQGSHDPPWRTDAGITAFTPFPQNTDYFGSDTQAWMLNFRVRDLDKMAAQLQSKGITVKVDPVAYPYGRFARLHDPEGNPIELWQPKD